MKTDLHILHLEDNLLDAELVRMLLNRNGFHCTMRRVQTKAEFEASLEKGPHDLILSDFTLPDFNGLEALALAREKRPETPFLFVSGTIGEESAIEALRNGATDYVIKDRMARLEVAVRRALEEAAKREELKRAEGARAQSEFKYRQIFECLSEAALLAEAETGRIVDTNRQTEVLFGRSRSEILGLHLPDFHQDMSAEDFQNTLVEPVFTDGRATLEAEVAMKDCALVPVEIHISPIRIYECSLLLCLYRDITARRRMEAELEELRKRNAPSP